jgi:hypothetical protein
MKIKHSVLLVAVLLALAACSSQPFDIKDIAKTDIDMVADLHRQKTRDLVIDLMHKLYKRNPRELRKQPGASFDSRLGQLSGQARLQFDELGGVHGVEAMNLGLSKNYQGDRVFAVVVGLAGMLREAYGYKDEFYVLDDLDQQKLYVSARNIEVLVWRLTQSRDIYGKPLIYTNGFGQAAPNNRNLPPEVNLSFERLFGKLIAHQDMLAKIMSGKTQRAINSVAHSLVSMTFMPL